MGDICSKTGKEILGETAIKYTIQGLKPFFIEFVYTFMTTSLWNLAIWFLLNVNSAVLSGVNW